MMPEEEQEHYEVDVSGGQGVTIGKNPTVVQFFMGGSSSATAARRVVGERISPGVDLFSDQIIRREELRQLVLRREYVIISVTGRRGIGKSGLVARVLADFEDETGGDAGAVGGIVYLSTRTGVGTLDLARVFHAMAMLLGEGELTRLERLWDKDKSIAVPELLAALQNVKAVLVLDNLEDLQDPATRKLRDPALTAFLGSVCRTSRPPLVITTSQEALELPEELHHHRYEIEIDKGIDVADAISYLRKADARGAAGLRDASDNELLHLVKRVHQVPWGLELLVSGRAKDRKYKLNDNVEKTADAVLRALALERLKSLNNDDVERSVVYHLALAKVPVSADAFEIILSGLHPPLAVRNAIVELVYRLVLGKDESRTVRLNPIDADYITCLLADYPEERAKIDIRLADWLVTQRTEARTWRTSTDLGPQRREFRHRIRAGETSGALRVLYDIAEFLALHGESSRVRSMLQCIAAPSPGTEEMVQYQHTLGLIESYEGSLNEAIRSFGRAWETTEFFENSLVRARAGIWYGSALRSAGRAQESIVPSREAVRVVASAAETDRDLHAFGLLQLALAQCYVGLFEEANNTTSDLEKLLRTSDSVEAWGFLHDAKALMYLGIGELDNALMEVNEGTACYADSRYAPTAGYLINIRGIIELRRKKYEESIKDFNEAIDIAQLAGEPRLEGMASLNVSWAFFLTGRRNSCEAHAQTAVARLLGNGVLEVESARAMVRASRETNSSSMLEQLQIAVTESHGNPDLYRPTEGVLQNAILLYE